METVPFDFDEEEVTDPFFTYALSSGKELRYTVAGVCAAALSAGLAADLPCDL